MPRPSDISRLPPKTREAIQNELTKRNFSGYQEVVEWFEKNLKIKVSRSQIGRYGKKLKDQLETIKVASETANTFLDAYSDEKGALTDVSVRMVQQIIFTMLQNQGKEITVKDVQSLSSAVTSLSRASIQQRDYWIRNKSKLEDAAEKVTELLSDADKSKKQEIRKILLGLSDV